MIYPLNFKIKSIWKWVKKLQGEYLVKKQEIDNIEIRIQDIINNIPEAEPTPPPPPIEKYGYVIIHCHNPEGKELNSNAFHYLNTMPQIYLDGNYFVDGESDATHNQSHLILVGSHILTVKYNNITLMQSINISEGNTTTVTLVFSRQTYPLISYLSRSSTVNFTKTVIVSGSSEVKTEYVSGGWVQAVHTVYFAGEPYTIIGAGTSAMSIGSTYSATGQINIEGIGVPSLPGYILGTGRCSLFNDLFLSYPLETYLDLAIYDLDNWFVRGALHGDYPDFQLKRSSDPFGYKWQVSDSDNIHYYPLEQAYDTLVHPWAEIHGLVSVIGEESKVLTLPTLAGTLDIEIVSVPYDTLGTAV